MLLFGLYGSPTSYSVVSLLIGWHYVKYDISFPLSSSNPLSLLHLKDAYNAIALNIKVIYRDVRVGHFIMPLSSETKKHSTAYTIVQPIFQVLWDLILSWCLCSK